MDQFLNWVSANPIAIVALVVLTSVVVLAAAAAFLIAFFQGREIHFWPPKIGARTADEKKDDKVSSNSKPFKVAGKEELPDLLVPGNSPGDDKSQPPTGSPIASVHTKSKPIAILLAIEGPVSGNVYVIESRQRDLTVGQNKACDLPVGSHLLSRQHFRIIISLQDRNAQGKRRFAFELIDSGSINGTFLNGNMVRNPAILKDGDRIEAGDCAFFFYNLDFRRGAATQNRE